MRYLIFSILILASCSLGNKKREQSFGKKGDVFDYWFVNEQAIIDKGLLIKGKRITGQFNLKLAEIENDSLVFNWTYQDIRPISDSLLTDLDKIYGDTLEVTSEFTVVYSTDKKGVFQNVLNWSEIKDFHSAKFDSIFKEELLTSKLASIKKERIKHSFVNDGYLFKKIIEPIVSFHSPYSIDFDQKESESTMVVDNDTLKTELLENFDNGVLLLITDGIKDQEAQSAINTFSGMLGVDVVPNSNFVMRDSVLINFDLASNYPTKLVYWRSFNLGTTNNKIQYSIIKK